MANEVVKYGGALGEIEQIVKDTNFIGGGAEGSITAALEVAQATSRVRELITPEMMKDVMSLQGTILGFKTDKDREKVPGYPVEVVKECFLAMSFYGLQPVNNQWNIIAGNPYIAKNGMKHIMDNIPGLTDFKPLYGVPKVGGGSVTTECSATWKFNGQEQRIECTIPVNPNNGTAVDQVLGKVERKFRKRVIEQISGCSTIPDGEAEYSTAKPVEARVSGSDAVTAKLDQPETPKELLIKQLGADCETDEQRIEIVDAFAGAQTLRGFKPKQFAELWEKIGPGGTERQGYIDSLGALGLEAK
jgi:hypothetical protein